MIKFQVAASCSLNLIFLHINFSFCFVEKLRASWRVGKWIFTACPSSTSVSYIETQSCILILASGNRFSIVKQKATSVLLKYVENNRKVSREIRWLVHTGSSIMTEEWVEKSIFLFGKQNTNNELHMISSRFLSFHSPFKLSHSLAVA